jgi:DNA-binding IclR family transcriptional regulator
VAGGSTTPGTTVVSRIFAVLGAFDAEHRSLTLSELARRSGQPLTTTFRLAGELVQAGALVRAGAGRAGPREYTIGRRMWDLGLLAPVQSGLREIASPFLHDIYGATLATVHLAVRDGTETLYLDRLAGHASVPVVSRVGARLPLYSTGVGKVLLAFAPAEVQAAVLADLRRLTPYTITQPGRLREQLRRVHRDGYAQAVDEMTLGACSVAVPVRDREGEVVASLGVVVPDLKRDRPRLVAALQVAAQGVGRSVG